MMDWSMAVGGVLCAWVFLLMLSHERQRRMQELDAEWALEQQQRSLDQAAGAQQAAAAERRKAA